MFIFNLTKKNLSTKKKNFFFFKQKVLFKNNFCNILLLNNVLSKHYLINNVQLEKKEVGRQFYTELNSFYIVIDNNIEKLNDLEKNLSLFFKIKKSSVINTKLKKNLLSFLSYGSDFKNNLILLTLSYNFENCLNSVNKIFLIENFYLRALSSLILYNYKEFKFYKIFNSNFFFDKKYLSFFQYYFFQKSLISEYFSILSLNDFLNSFKVLFILSNYKNLK